MATKHWNDLSPWVRGPLAGAGAADIVLRIVALTDLARRPTGQVRGSKRRWAAALVLVSSGGALPLTYLARGRRRT